MARERKTFMAGYFYDWLKGDYYLKVEGLDNVDDHDLFVIDKMIEERVSRYGVNDKGRWFRFKIEDLNQRVVKLKHYLAVYGL